MWKTAVTKRQAKLGEKVAEELPKLLEASATGIIAPYIISKRENPRNTIWSEEDIPGMT